MLRDTCCITFWSLLTTHRHAVCTHTHTHTHMHTRTHASVMISRWRAGDMAGKDQELHIKVAHLLSGRSTDLSAPQLGSKMERKDVETIVNGQSSVTTA